MNKHEVRGMARGRKSHKEITSHFVQSALALASKEDGPPLTLPEISEQSGIALSTWRDWAFEVSSPWQQIELVAQLMEVTGLSPREMLELLRTEEEAREAS